MVLDLRLNEKIGLSGDNLLFFTINKDEVPNHQTSEAKQSRRLKQAQPNKDEVPNQARRAQTIKLLKQ